jgi:hypothetical protein
MAQRRRIPLLITVIACLCMLAAPCDTASAQRPGWGSMSNAETDEIKVDASTIEVDFAEGPLDLPNTVFLTHIQAAVSAVATYYGRFPVDRARVLMIPVAGRQGFLQGTTWGGMRGVPGFTRIRIGEHTMHTDLAEDWMTTHELVHMAFPSMPDDQHWIEEGLATYVEPIARVMTGELSAKQVWSDMVRDMHQGEPAPGDEGLDRTHTWGRTYWGGAMFCLVADVQIRRETNNRKGLQDALREIVARGGTIDHDWNLPQAFAIGDRATGTQVLTRMYAEWKDKPVTVDLSALWKELGIQSTPQGIEFTGNAPEAKIREAITEARGDPASATVVPRQVN